MPFQPGRRQPHFDFDVRVARRRDGRGDATERREAGVGARGIRCASHRLTSHVGRRTAFRAARADSRQSRRREGAGRNDLSRRDGRVGKLERAQALARRSAGCRRANRCGLQEHRRQERGHKHGRCQTRYQAARGTSCRKNRKEEFYRIRPGWFGLDLGGGSVCNQPPRTPSAPSPGAFFSVISVISVALGGPPIALVSRLVTGRFDAKRRDQRIARRAAPEDLDLVRLQLDPLPAVRTTGDDSAFIKPFTDAARSQQVVANLVSRAPADGARHELLLQDWRQLVDSPAHVCVAGQQVSRRGD